MRNLKKVLSLSLALVMLLGMMVVGAGAATYEDVAAGSDQECAIEVMSAIKVFTGTDDGFAPEKTLSRAEAATIVARLVYTKATVDKMTAIGSTFADVQEKAPWAAGAIEACVNDHILDGDGEGNFNPTGEVTGYQFGKMLLMAIGYGDEGKYTGANWEYNVRQDLLAAGLDDGMAPSVLSNSPMKRADAAQMAFDAATYSPSGYKWAVGGLPGVFDTAQEAMLYGYILGEENLTPVKVPGNDSIAALTYGLTVETEGEEAEDAYGRPAVTWMLDNEPIYKDVTGASVVLTKAYAKASSLPTALKNGTYGSVACVKNGADAADVTSAADLAALTANGTIVEVYMSSKAVTKVIVIEPELVAVTKVDTKNNTFTIATSNGAFKIDEDSDFAALIGEVEVDDVLACVSNKDDVLELYDPEVITGTLTFVKKGETEATIDGTTVKAFGDVKFDNTLVTKEVVAVMVNGYAIAMVELDAAPKATGAGDNYIWVTNLWSEKASYKNDYVVKVMGVLADGTVKTLTLANPTSDGGSFTGSWVKTPATTTGATNPTDLGVYAVPTNATLAGTFGGAKLFYYYEGKGASAGKYLLAKADSEKVGTVASTGAPMVTTTQAKLKGQVVDTAYYIASDVDMVWISGDGDKLTASLTGREVIAAEKGYTYILDKNNRAAVIFVDTTARTSENVVYVAANAGKASFVNADGKTASGNKVTYYVHGSDEAETAIATGYSAPGFYTIQDNGEGYALTAYTLNVVSEEQLSCDALYNGFLTIDGKSEPVNIKKAEIIDLRGLNDVVFTVDQLQELVEDTELNTTVSLIIEPDDTAKAVYIVDSKEAMQLPSVKLEKPAADAPAGTATKVTVSPAQGAFQINIADADKNAADKYEVTVKGNNGYTNPAITDWGDPDVTIGFVVFFTKGAYDGKELTLTICDHATGDEVLSEDQTVAADAKGYVFYTDVITEAGVYDWAISCAETETILDFGFFEMVEG